jgi:ubiquinone/menaquinone biosynthesis C-methylase UbiE
MTDYDQTGIPDAYDRGRDHGPEVLHLWMRAVAAHLNGSPARILDLGCGTGRFSDALAVAFDAEVIGIDPSFQMLSRALAKRREGRVRYARACAEAVPLRPGSVDAVFMSMSLHHFTDAAAAATECRRVLVGGGHLFIRTGTRDQIPAYPYYPFFPATHPILEEVLPDGAGIRRTFEGAGLRTIAQDVITQTIAPDWSTYADKLATRTDSVLARLTAHDFDRGMAEVRQHALRAAEPVVEPIDFFVFRRV